MIVDLPVEDDPQSAVCRPHGLRPAAEIDDGQTPVPQVNRLMGVMPQTLGVGTPMDHGLIHGRKDIHIAGSGKTANSAHDYFCSNLQHSSIR